MPLNKGSAPRGASRADRRTTASVGCLLAIALLHVGRLDGLVVLARLLVVGGLAFAVGYAIEERTSARSESDTK